MQAYELLFIVRTDLEEEKISGTIDWVANLIREHGGIVDKVDRWAKRRLAYEIKGQRDGIYVLFNFQGDASCVGELDRLLKISDSILRHMIVKQVGGKKKEVSPEKGNKKEQLPETPETAPAPAVQQEGPETVEQTAQE